MIEYMKESGHTIQLEHIEKPYYPFCVSFFDGTGAPAWRWVRVLAESQAGALVIAAYHHAGCGRQFTLLTDADVLPLAMRHKRPDGSAWSFGEIITHLLPYIRRENQNPKGVTRALWQAVKAGTIEFIPQQQDDNNMGLWQLAADDGKTYVGAVVVDQGQEREKRRA